MTGSHRPFMQFSLTVTMDTTLLQYHQGRRHHSACCPRPFSHGTTACKIQSHLLPPRPRLSFLCLLTPAPMLTSPNPRLPLAVSISVKYVLPVFAPTELVAIGNHLRDRADPPMRRPRTQEEMAPGVSLTWIQVSHIPGACVPQTRLHLPVSGLVTPVPFCLHASCCPGQGPLICPALDSRCSPAASSRQSAAPVSGPRDFNLKFSKSCFPILY